MDEETSIKLFENKKIRSVWNKEEEEWYFALVDVVEALTDSVNPRDYYVKLRKRDPELQSYISLNCPSIKMISENGVLRKTPAGNAKHIFRVVQSIPSPKAEPFKLWLAQVGYERLQEIENPEIAQDRIKQIYEDKGYSKDWIDKRLRGIAVRQSLTGEWRERGISKERDFAILTAEISKASFGMTPSEYKMFKGLSNKNENLRDHMTDMELIFTMLGESATTQISQNEMPEGMSENVDVSRRGGRVAGNARKDLENELGHSVLSSDNFLDIRLKRLKGCDSDDESGE